MDAGLRRGVAAAVVLLIVCVLAVGVVSAETVTVSDFGELQRNISATGDRTIIVADNISITSQLIIDRGKNITLTTNDADHTLSRGNSFTDNLFIVNSGGNLTITGNSTQTTNLTLDGMDQDSDSLVKVSGSFTLADGGILTNNTASQGGGVYLQGGTFTMSGGEISGNEASYDGGGVYLQGGTFTMSGGTISSNTASYGGGVCMFGTFEMSGGEISGNEASYGGGVCM